MIRLTIASMVRPSPLQSDGSVAAAAVTPTLVPLLRATPPATATSVDRFRDQRRAGSAIVRMLALCASMLRAVLQHGRESMLRRGLHEIHTRLQQTNHAARATPLAIREGALLLHECTAKAAAKQCILHCWHYNP